MLQREVERIRVGQLELRFLFSGAETGNALTMFEMTVPPGARVPGAHFERLPRVVAPQLRDGMPPRLGDLG